MIVLSTWMNADCTLGRLQCGDFRCFTLELPWRDNQRSISCIPAGVYSAGLYQSPRHGMVVLFDDVPNRSMIEIHAGNYTRQIEGCVLVGDSIRYLDGDSVPDVTNSRATLLDLLSLLPDRFQVQVNRV